MGGNVIERSFKKSDLCQVDTKTYIEMFYYYNILFVLTLSYYIHFCPPTNILFFRYLYSNLLLYIDVSWDLWRDFQYCISHDRYCLFAEFLNCLMVQVSIKSLWKSGPCYCKCIKYVKLSEVVVRSVDVVCTSIIL